MYFIKNFSSKNVKVSIDGEAIGIIQQGESISYNQAKGQCISLILSHTEESFVKRKRAHMLIETTYKFLPVEGAEYSVRREKMRFENGAYYDNFFLCYEDENILPEKYMVIGGEKLRQALIHTGICWKLLDSLEDMFTDFVVAPIPTLLVSALIVVCLGWKWLFIVGGCIYVLYFVCNCVGSGVAKIMGNLLGNKLKEESVEERLNRWVDSEYIAEFYLKPDRKPYMGKIER